MTSNRIRLSSLSNLWVPWPGENHYLYSISESHQPREQVRARQEPSSIPAPVPHGVPYIFSWPGSRVLYLNNIPRHTITRKNGAVSVYGADSVRPAVKCVKSNPIATRQNCQWHSPTKHQCLWVLSTVYLVLRLQLILLFLGRRCKRRKIKCYYNRENINT